MSGHHTFWAAFAAAEKEERKFRRNKPRFPGMITAEVRIFVDGEEKTAEYIGDGYAEVMARQAALDAEAGV